MEKYFSKINKNTNAKIDLSSRAKEEHQSKRVCIELSDDSLIADPGQRKPIDSYPPEIRDDLRRRYWEKGPCQPREHPFPRTLFSTDYRCFQRSWFDDYPWLEYSISKDAAFCLYCYVFDKGNKNGSESFTEDGFRNWKKGTEKFIKHIGGLKSPHHDATEMCLGLKNQRLNVDYMLSSVSKATEVAYRTRLTAIVKVIRFLLGQGLAFRGHDESQNSIQRGNFLELVTWYCKENEEVRKVMDLNAPRNNQLTSPSIQKDIISACAAETTKIILNEIKGKLFSLLLDEARDSSVKEQMSIVLRFVNNSGEVVESFIGLVHVSDTTAQSLKGAIDDFFAKNGLSISSLRGQGYDGASNMSGELNGLKSLILNENQHAHYVHCFAHRIQLVVVTVAGKIGMVNSFFDYLSMIVNIAGASCKRRDNLRQLQHDEMVKRLEKGDISAGKGKHQETSLARPGDTRWGSHYKTITRLLHMWKSVQQVLLVVCKEGNDPKSKGAADSLLHKMFDFEFVFIAHLMLNILGLTNLLSKSLQEKTQNIGKAVRMVKATKASLQAYRKDSWKELLDAVVAFCNANEIIVPKMEDVMPGRARKMIDGEPRTYFHHFYVEIFIEVVDRITNEMENRFSESNSELLMCIACLDPSNSFASFDHDRLLQLAQLYSEDFSGSDLLQISQQLRIYISSMRSDITFANLEGIGGLAIKMVENDYHTLFPLVYRLIELALVLPVATATVERSFSAMKLIKTDLRNKMGDEFLSDCLVCYIEKKIFQTIKDEVIMNHFQRMKKRMIQLPRIKLVQGACATTAKDN